VNRRLPLLTIAATALALAAGLAGGSATAADPAPSDTTGSHVTVSVPSEAPASGPDPDPVPRDTGGTTVGGVTGGGFTGGGSGSGAGRQVEQAAVVAAGPTEPRIARTPSTSGERATVDKSAYRAGDPLTVSFGGFTPGEKVQVVLYSEPILIGNFDAGPDGAVAQAFTLPSDLPAGAHTLQLTGWQSGKVATVSFVVASPATAAAPDIQGMPVWAWWIGGGVLAILAAVGAWWLVRALRRPVEVTA
jgi:hypothetical protein